MLFNNQPLVNNQYNVHSNSFRNYKCRKEICEYVSRIDAVIQNESLDKFNSTQDYNNLSSLGPSLPKCNYKFPEPQNVTKAAESTVTLKFKSIKPPFKFLTELSNIPVNFTIYKVKAQLIESLEILHNAGVTAKDLKLMIKSKVAQDAAALSSLVNTEEPISFNCMVSAPSGGKPAATTSKTDEDDPELEAVSDPVSTTATTSSISEAGWNKYMKLYYKI